MTDDQNEVYALLVELKKHLISEEVFCQAVVKWRDSYVVEAKKELRREVIRLLDEKI